MVSSEFESKEAYLLKVNQELHRKRPLLFTSQRSAIIASFEQTFGVVISAQSAFPYFLKTECLTQSKTFELDGFSARSINFRVSEDGVFLNSSIPKLRLNGTNTLMLTLSLTSPSQKHQNIYQNECGSQRMGFNAAFRDNGRAFSGPTCQYIGTGSETYRPTQLFSTFTGEYVKGTWIFEAFASTARIAELRWSICYVTDGGGMSRNFAVANLNFPAYSERSGWCQLTSTYRNYRGELLYITIRMRE